METFVSGSMERFSFKGGKEARRSRSVDAMEARRSREELLIGSGDVADLMKIRGLEEAGWTGYWEEGLLQRRIRPTKDAAAAKRKEDSIKRMRKAAAAEAEGEKRAADETAGTGSGEKGGLTRLSGRLLHYILAWTPEPITDPDEYYAQMTNDPLSRECFSQEYIDRSTATLRKGAEVCRETNAMFEKLQAWARAEYERKGCVEVDDAFIQKRLMLLEEEGEPWPLPREEEGENWAAVAFGNEGFEVAGIVGGDWAAAAFGLEGLKVVGDEEGSDACNATEILDEC